MPVLFLLSVWVETNMRIWLSLLFFQPFHKHLPAKTHPKHEHIIPQILMCDLVIFLTVHIRFSHVNFLIFPNISIQCQRSWKLDVNNLGSWLVETRSHEAILLFILFSKIALVFFSCQNFSHKTFLLLQKIIVYCFLMKTGVLYRFFSRKSNFNSLRNCKQC